MNECEPFSADIFSEPLIKVLRTRHPIDDDECQRAGAMFFEDELGESLRIISFGLNRCAVCGGTRFR
jgi:hypothetical protein